MLRLWAVVFLLLSSAAPALAEGRIALLIGNKSYSPAVGVLINPHNDIELLSRNLRQVGFDVLPLVKDAKRSTILGAVRELVRKLNAAGPGAVGFLYYSGHGAAETETGINYLIPVDATDPTASSFWDEALKLDDVLRLLAGAKGAAKIIVFDACRNELALPVKSTSKGFVPVSDQQGSFIAYASEFGRTASDKGTTSGPYAAALAAEILKPGLDHLGLFQNVKEAVIAITGGSQRPWESNGLSRRVYLNGQVGGTALPVPPVAPQPVVTPPPVQPPPPVAQQLDEQQRRDLRRLFEIAQLYAGQQSRSFVNRITFGIGQAYRSDGSFLVPTGEAVPARSTLGLASRNAVAKAYDEAVNTIISRYPTPRGATAGLVADYFGQLKSGL